MANPDESDDQISFLTEPETWPRIVTDPITGWPVLDGGPNAPVLTNEMVRAILDNEYDDLAAELGRMHSANQPDS